jgi:dTDP-4-dehydrorhamnose 3,5-epimerase
MSGHAGLDPAPIYRLLLPMNVIPTALPEVLILEPKVFGDDRGFFFESWNQNVLDGIVGQPQRFVQDNHSRSAQGVLRGIHYQIRQAQGKLVRVSAGRVFDVAVDLRRSSPRLGQWVGVELSAENKRQMWVPPGFGHGFLVLSESADFLYKTTDYYAPAEERALLWNDSHVNVAWPLGDVGGPPTLSGKDAGAKRWGAVELFG